MARASLAMYDFCPAVRHANDKLWHIVRQHLEKAGFNAPDELDRVSAYDEVWREPDLVFAQTCGYPFVKELKGLVRLVASPVYCFPGGHGVMRSSFVVVRDDSGIEALEQLRGRRAAINDIMSNSGMNLLRALLAPFAIDGRFFASTIITGGHVASLVAIREGRADVASIDSVTYGLLALHESDTLRGLEVIAQTPSGPGLPFISRRNAPDMEIDVLREALSEIVSDPRHRHISEPLGLSGIEFVDGEVFEALARLEASAVAQDYPVIA